MTFDVLVVTSPDSTAAKAADEGPLKEVDAPKIKSTHDPYNTRCGSGGGTIAALLLCEPQDTVLIIHAGGESSRCPTQMVLGKSWTTLPCNDGGAMTIQTPTSLMAKKLQDLLQGIPKGSLVVAASDTLLQLSSPSIDWSLQDENAVIGVAVPAPLDTAKNHGVYVLAQGTAAHIQPVHDFLQKPSSKMMNESGAAFTHGGEPCAWIDTGIVIFLPKAARALRQLAQDDLACCCWEGLEDMWKNSGETATTLQDYAKKEAKKIELYTHLLMALSTSTNTTLAGYLERHDDLPKHLLTAIYEHLSPFSLQTLVIPEGQFLHLGTSKELVHFLVQGSLDSDSTSPGDLRSVTMGRDLHLVSEYQSLLTPTPSEKRIVCYNSLLQTTGQLTLGQGSVLEHVHVNATVDISIGQGCLISGWRGEYTSANVVISDKTCLQVMPLLEDGLYVVMVFGMDDDIKQWTRVHGVDVTTFLQATGLDDLWDSHEKQFLWTAKLHPIVKEVDLPRLFSWIQQLQETGRIADPASLNYYKSCRRLSLQQVRGLSNARQEWTYRYDLERIVLPLHHNLWNRQHIECCTELHETTYATLSEVCWKAMMAEKYDVCGRTFMVASAMLADRGNTDVEDIPEDLQVILRKLRNTDDRVNSCKALFEGCNNYVRDLKFSESSLALELAASVMTELCVCGTAKPSFPRVATAPVNSWIIATAPIRVDLSGGWSDTPPICYEYGGAVAGLAVTVDGCKPLSCRCRIVLGGQGIRLCTESRESASGDLLSDVETHLLKVGDLDDCRNPTADCALLKCALIYLGLLPESTKPTDELQSILQTFCRMDQQIGLEIVSTSLLPRGSGLGTSSILAGCVLAAIAQCVGIDLGNKDDNRLIHVVLLLEQLLTCGGGWQDQIGGLVGGLKLGTSKANEFPVSAQVQRITMERSTIEKLDSRLILVFTGQTRLAKNILQNVLRRWSLRTPEIVGTVEALAKDANRVSKALGEGDLGTLAECLNSYWSQKKIMAGDQSGVEPEVARFVLAELFKRSQIVAGSLCGAGGGGFMVLLAAEGRTMKDIQNTFAQEIVPLNQDAASFTWHKCQVSTQGLSTFRAAITDEFDIAWHDGANAMLNNVN